MHKSHVDQEEYKTNTTKDTQFHPRLVKNQAYFYPGRGDEPARGKKVDSEF
ncbi:unnamed protein product [marine sediment metagenome]|uniref:Uncharacterized protein n=1 Tax=marine sediment metagenome TaxID=412755 RepID=X1EWY6_9ZZZZ